MADEYPLSGYPFRVEWGGATLAFQEVSGLGVRPEIVDYREGGSNEYDQQHSAGTRKYDSITMKRGVLTGDIEFYEWWESVANDSGERHELKMTLLNEEHKPVVAWKVRNAWARKVQPTDLKASGYEVAIEELELVHEGLTIESE